MLWYEADKEQFADECRREGSTLGAWGDSPEQPLKLTVLGPAQAK